jgi:hypothetical protein
MNTENFQLQQATLPFLPMLERNIEDVCKVGFINFAAFAVSMSEFDQWLRLAGLAAALVYTCLKIVQTVQEIIRKK